MKKSLRKLSLSRETLRCLENPVLNQVGGGGPKTTLCPTHETNCDCTFSCPENCPSAATFC
ncbi:MAG: hypothetical protein ACJ75H_02530 [Thermoanaerobaculia bacterium]